MYMSEKIRRHYVVKGRVQGVGFRYKAYYAAQAYRLTGYVRNMYSGDVEIEVQGNRETVDKFFEFAYRDRYIQIDDIKSTNMPIIEDERSFKVKDSY